MQKRGLSKPVSFHPAHLNADNLPGNNTITPNPTDKEAYFEEFTKLLNDRIINMHTIRVDNTIPASIAKFEMEGDKQVS